MCMFSYRQATPQDLCIVTELSLLLWPGHTREDLDEENARNLANPNNMIFLAFLSDFAVGFAYCALRYDYVEGTNGGNVGYLEGIYVRPEYQRQGIARALVTLCEDWSRTRGCCEFASDCELGNTASLNFHLHLGFAEANRVICFTKKL